MVSSVLVELVGDDEISSTLSGDSGEVGKCISGTDVALGIGEEGILGVKIECPRHET